MEGLWGVWIMGGGIMGCRDYGGGIMGCRDYGEGELSNFLCKIFEL